ncbi:GLPGLI family protein [Polaribacter sp.]|uniref:GLPGLI family protein n=1 Tax=Polaribacter sp. TaxID=1920175 RepID=UPI0040478A74
MKKSIILIYLFLSFNLHSQSGEVIYEAEMIPIDYETKLKSDTISETQKATLRAIFKNQPKVFYQLVFNTNESFFEKEKVLNSDNNSFNIAETKMGKGIYYTNNTAKLIIHQKESLGGNFLISIPPFEWKLIQETKKIGNYICFKATTIKYVEGRNGKMQRAVIAWYTTQIPYNFGPKDYNGLPGLILELQEDNLLINATKITIQPAKKRIIEKPSKGEKVTQQEYDSLVKKIYNERRKMLKQ